MGLSFYVSVWVTYSELISHKVYVLYQSEICTHTHTHLAMLKMHPKHVKVLKLIFILLHVTKRINVHVNTSTAV